MMIGVSKKFLSVFTAVPAIGTRLFVKMDDDSMSLIVILCLATLCRAGSVAESRHRINGIIHRYSYTGTGFCDCAQNDDEGAFAEVLSSYFNQLKATSENQQITVDKRKTIVFLSTRQ
jgi:hypothetical protein